LDSYDQGIIRGIDWTILRLEGASGGRGVQGCGRGGGQRLPFEKSSEFSKRRSRRKPTESSEKSGSKGKMKGARGVAHNRWVGFLCGKCGVVENQPGLNPNSSLASAAGLAYAWGGRNS